MEQIQMDIVLRQHIGKCRLLEVKFSEHSDRPQLTTYSLVSLIFCLLTFFNIWRHADVVRVANKVELSREFFLTTYRGNSLNSWQYRFSRHAWEQSLPSLVGLEFC